MSITERYNIERKSGGTHMFTNISDHAIIIAPSYLHNQIRASLLSDKNGMVLIQLLSLSTFLNKHTMKKDISNYQRLFTFYHRMSELRSTLKIFHKTCCSPTFLMQCNQMIDDMKLFHITPDQLPENTLSQIELKSIVHILYDIPSASDITINALENIAKKGVNNLYIYDSYYTYNEQHALKQLSLQKLTCINSMPTKRHFYTAVNKRQEIEAIAQYIIRQDLKAEDINITICDSTYKPLIKQLFERYEIPYTLLKQSKSNIITKRYVCFLTYLLEATNEHLISLLDTNVFDIPHLQELKSYMQIFQCEINDNFQHVKDIHHDFEIIDNRELEQLNHLEQLAGIAQAELLPILHDLNATNSIKKALIYIDKIVSSNSREENRGILKKIRTICEECLPDLIDNEAIKMLIYFIDQLQDNTQSSEYQGVLIHDLKNSHLQRKYLFIMGATQKNYPAFATNNGIFDEEYISLIPNYPTLEQRYEHHQQCMEKELANCEEIIISYPSGTYEGKTNEAALEIEEFTKCKAKPIPLLINYEPITMQYKLEAKTAQELFLKDQKLRGSISAFERYVRCPFSYFLRYGLHVKEPYTHGFNEAKIGTLAHYAMEQLVVNYGKQYAEVSIEKVASLLEKEIKGILSVYPNFEDTIAITKQRLLYNIEQNLKHLKEQEEHSHFQPIRTEYEFFLQTFADLDLEISLHGFIDRIDEGDGFLQILDYKSSAKSLVETNVFSALQLQLVTYALIAKKDFQKRVMGAYYISLKNENIQCTAGKMRRRPIEYITFDKQDYKDNVKAAHRLQGWNFEQGIEAIDDDGSHIVGVSQKSDGTIQARKTYDLDKLEEHFNTMFSHIAKSIKSGEINCVPNEDACLYCKYHEICRFKGFPAKKELLCEIDDSIYK